MHRIPITKNTAIGFQLVFVANMFFLPRVMHSGVNAFTLSNVHEQIKPQVPMVPLVVPRLKRTVSITSVNEAPPVPPAAPASASVANRIAKKKD
jgi:hypothetical protein